jgi:hypothetical protein
VISFKDRTWCIDKKCAKYDQCDRSFKSSDAVAAKQWWGSDSYPLSVFGERRECFVQSYDEHGMAK